MPDDDSPQFKPFLPTDWPLVESAGRPAGDDQQKALAELLQQYLPVLKDYLRLQFRCDAHQTDDYLQSFVLDQVLKKELIAQADRKRGKFRTFLLHALNHFVLNERRNASAKKRAPAEGLVPLDELPLADLETLTEQSRSHFDIAFAREVIAKAMRRMQAECAAAGRQDLWAIFDARVLGPAFEQTEPPPYDELVRRFSLQTPAQASNLLITAKRMYARVLRSVVAEYIDGEREVAAEIRELQAILAEA